MIDRFKWPVFTFVLVLSVLLSGHAYAWPSSSQWIPIYKDNALLQDDTGDTQGSRNVVSDPTHAAGFIFNDGTYLYFRLRLDKDPTGTGGQGLLQAYGWGVEVDTDQDPSDYEWLIMLDGISKTEAVQLWQNTVQGTLGDPGDKAEVLYSSVPLTGNYQISLADTTINGDQDYFLDWRFPYATFKQATGLTDSSPIRLFFGSSPSTNNLTDNGGDLVGGSDLYSGLSDVITPLGTGPATGTVRFVEDLAGNGDVTEIYVGDTLFLRVDDGDVNYNNATLQTVTVTLVVTSGDTAQVTLTETGINTGIFISSIPTQYGGPVAGDSILQVTPGATISVEYIDFIDANYNLNQIRADSVYVMALEPAISLVKGSEPETGVPGQEIIYTVHYHNLGTGEATNLVIVDSIPFFTTYVAGSMRIGNAESTYDTSTTLTDADSDDEGRFSGNSVIFTISSVAADDGAADSGSDEGKIYFKVRID